MGTHPYFNHYNYFNGQNVLDSIIVDAIKARGVDVIYLPRRLNNFDGVYGEDPVSSFDKPYYIEMYPKTTKGFEGKGSIFTIFNAEIRDEMTFTISKTRFENDITSQEADIHRPREGDLIFFPMAKKCFEIKYVNNKPIFYGMGALYLYDMDCELYEYSNEIFDTGIDEIDSLQKNFSINSIDYGILTEDGYNIISEDGDYLVTENIFNVQQEFDPLVDNDRIETEKDVDDIIDFSESNPFSEGRY